MGGRASGRRGGLVGSCKCREAGPCVWVLVCAAPRLPAHLPARHPACPPSYRPAAPCFVLSSERCLAFALLQATSTGSPSWPFLPVWCSRASGWCSQRSCWDRWGGHTLADGRAGVRQERRSCRVGKHPGGAGFGQGKEVGKNQGRGGDEGLKALAKGVQGHTRRGCWGSCSLTARLSARAACPTTSPLEPPVPSLLIS